MSNLGNIRVSVKNNKYSVQFKYATPRTIDFFELTLMEIIKHKGNFQGQRIGDILQMMEIPDEFNNFFIERLRELINTSGQAMIAFTRPESEEDVIYLDEQGNITSPSYLWNGVSDFSLTPAGEDVYSSKEIPEDPKAFAGEYVYDIVSKKLGKIEDGPDESVCIVVNMPRLEPESVNETFFKIIAEKPYKFIGSGKPNDETKIHDLAAAPSGSVGKFAQIAVFIDSKGKISFHNENKTILQAFLDVSQEEKQRLKTVGMFNYLDIPQTVVNYEKSKIAAKRNPIKMKAVFGDDEAIRAITDTENNEYHFGLDVTDLTELREAHNFCFAGITVSGQPLVYNYCEVEEAGYTIPLEEEDHSPHTYSPIYKAFLDMFISEVETGDDREDIIKSLIVAAPNEQKASVVKEILGRAGSFDVKIENAGIILPLIEDDKKLADKVNEHILDLAKKSLSDKSTDAGKIINLLIQHGLPKDRVIKLLADGAPKTDDTINTLLALDEAETIRVYDLKKWYNSLLKEGRLSEISHKTNLYASFAAYEVQYKKLQAMGFKDYYHYDTPHDWDAFIKETHNLKNKFEQIKKHLDADTIKPAEDFFERAQDDYDVSAPIDEKAVKQLLGKDIEKEIKAKNFDAQLIACAIRSKYEEYLRSIEITKDPKADGQRRGKALIQFTIEPKLADDAYKHWINLNKLVHKDTEKDHPLWKGNDKARQDALSRALFFYKKLISKGGKK